VLEHLPAWAEQPRFGKQHLAEADEIILIAACSVQEQQ
jgi:hypothetical protein